MEWVGLEVGGGWGGSGIGVVDTYLKRLGWTWVAWVLTRPLHGDTNFVWK